MHDEIGTTPAEATADSDEVLTYEEVSAELKVKPGTLHCWVHQHLIPHVRLGPRSVRFRRSDIQRWLAQRAAPVQSNVKVVGR